MSATVITNSPNIASLDSLVNVDLCAGIFHVSIIPSVWIGSGASNVMGASVKITNPYNVVIKNYPTSGYDIYPPMTSIVDVNVPTQANNFQYGSYTITVQLTDANGTLYTVTKTVNICAPDVNNKTRNYGSLSAQLNGVCTDGKVYVIADGVPNYNGVISDTQVNDFTLEYPTSSGLDELDTTIGSFSTNLFEGVYKFTGTICANYPYGDNVSVKVNYRLKREKNIRCLLDETCISQALGSLDAQVRSDCTDAEKLSTQNTIIQALRLIKTIEVTASSGFDASDYIDELETVLGCVCTCNCAEGTPIINNNPTGDFLIEGCNVVRTTVGLTTHYQIDNYAYSVAVAPNGGVITVSVPTLADCTETQTITFNIVPLYEQIKGQIVNNTEYSYWASILNQSWDSLDVSCFGYSPEAWALLTYTERSQIMVSKICAGATCAAVISSNSTSNTGSDVIASWTNVSGVYEVFAYKDGVLAGSVLSPLVTFRFIGAADGTNHVYTLISKCNNGSSGIALQSSATYYGCPAIAAPAVSSNNIADATCPYNLNALLSALPPGITSEWHNLNNTNASSLVPDPTMVTGGVYFVFGKDSNGCYSIGTQVTLTCSTGTACSAPQNLLVESIVGGFRVRFQGAAYPPPLNSYTVKRRLTSDPDISGSYTTIGTPTYNAGAARWEILDNTPPSNNVSYTYRAISNCTSSAPYVDYVFANITCPVVTLTPATNSMDYSFTGVGGGVDKYEVRIYAADGITLIHTDTHVPAFSNPITGTFIYLTQGTSYKVRVRIFIGTYYIDCAFVSGTTTSVGQVTVVNGAAGYVINGVTNINGYSLGSPLTTGQTGTGTHTQNGSTGVCVDITIGVVAAHLSIYINNILQQCIPNVSLVGGSNCFSSISIGLTDSITIQIIVGATC